MGAGWIGRSAATTFLRSWQDTNCIGARIRCTVQVCSQVASMASPNPVSPSQQTMTRPRTSRALLTFPWENFMITNLLVLDVLTCGYSRDAIICRGQRATLQQAGDCGRQSARYRVRPHRSDIGAARLQGLHESGRSECQEH